MSIKVSVIYGVFFSLHFDRLGGRAGLVKFPTLGVKTGCLALGLGAVNFDEARQIQEPAVWAQ